MGFRTGSYAKVWSVEPKTDVNTVIRISVSRKNKKTGEYEQEFSGFVSCLGTVAAKKAAGLKEGDRIKLGDVDVSTSYNAETKQSFTSFKCFGFDLAEETTNSYPIADSGESNSEVDNGEVDESNLPF